MSGAVSIPFAFFAITFGGNAGFWFAVLAYVSLWVLVIGLARKNYQILFVQKPAQRRVLYTKMVDFIRSAEQDIERRGRSFTTYDMGR